MNDTLQYNVFKSSLKYLLQTDDVNIKWHLKKSTTPEPINSIYKHGQLVKNFMINRFLSRVSADMRY